MSDRLDPPFSAPDRDPADLDGVRILVFGLGGFGGGAGAARFLAEQGAAVTVTDLRTPDQLGPALEILGDVPLAGRRLGGHDITDFTETDWVVVNPAIRPGNPLLSAATRAGARLVSEVAPPPPDPRRRLVRRLQDRLAGAARFHENQSYSFQEDDLLAAVGAADLPHVTVTNPVVESAARVRRGVLPSLLATLSTNRRHREEVRLFE